MKPLIILTIFLLLSSTLFAERITVDIRDQNKTQSWIALPYIISSNSMGFTGGIVAIFSGYGQKQMNIVASAFLGESLNVEKQLSPTNTTQESKNSQGTFLAITGYKLPFVNRLFISAYGSYAYYPNQQLYLDGSNNSVKAEDKVNDTLSPLRTQGYNNWYYMDFRYVLPFGENSDNPITTYKLDRGIPVNRNNYGGGLPFFTGRTILEIKPFYTNWTAEKLTQEPEWTTAGLKVMLQHDNTDYIDNPSRGYGFKLQYSQDFGNFNSTQTWNAMQAQYAQYIKLPNFKYTRMNTIALNVWSAYSPSWDKNNKLNPDIDNPVIDAHQPPPWEGARLGGWNRMRGYDSNRFNDKAAIYYGLEYRVIPQLNPLKDEKWLPIAIDWFQLVFFAEAGRVASSYDLQTLHSNMKSDIGFSLRALAAKVPVRFEMAFGEEGSSMWVMIQQPF